MPCVSVCLCTCRCVVLIVCLCVCVCVCVYVPECLFFFRKAPRLKHVFVLNGLTRPCSTSYRPHWVIGRLLIVSLTKCVCVCVCVHAFGLITEQRFCTAGAEVIADPLFYMTGSKQHRSVQHLFFSQWCKLCPCLGIKVAVQVKKKNQWCKFAVAMTMGNGLAAAASCLNGHQIVFSEPRILQSGNTQVGPLGASTTLVWGPSTGGGVGISQRDFFPSWDMPLFKFVQISHTIFRPLCKISGTKV